MWVLWCVCAHACSCVHVCVCMGEVVQGVGAAFDLFVCVDVSMFCMYASQRGVFERSIDGGTIFHGCMHVCALYLCVYICLWGCACTCLCFHFCVYTSQCGVFDTAIDGGKITFDKFKSLKMHFFCSPFLSNRGRWAEESVAGRSSGTAPAT